MSDYNIPFFGLEYMLLSDELSLKHLSREIEWKTYGFLWAI